MGELRTYLDAADALRGFADEVRAAVYVAADPVAADPDALGALAHDWSTGLRQASDLGLQPEGATSIAAGAIASCLHAWVQSAYADRSAGGLDHASLRALDRGLDARLTMLRRSAATGSAAGAARVLARMLATDTRALLAAAAAAPPSSDDPADGALAVGVARTTHRLAMLAAGAVHVQRRLAVPRLRASTAGIAARRVAGAMPRPRLSGAATTLDGTDPLERIALLARVQDVTWVDAGRRPHARCDLADGSQLRVHFRNVRLDGLAGGVWVWARAKAEPPADDGSRYAVAEFEGPTTTADRIWESWLAVEARASYDAAPRSVHLIAELPDPRSGPGRLHLLSRISPEAGD